MTPTTGPRRRRRTVDAAPSPSATGRTPADTDGRTAPAARGTAGSRTPSAAAAGRDGSGAGRAVPGAAASSSGGRDALRGSRTGAGTGAGARTPSPVPPEEAGDPTDPIVLGRRIRYRRKRLRITLEELARTVGMAPSALSLIENGKREPKLSTLSALAGALDMGVEQLLGSKAPSRRMELEIQVERVQRGPMYAALGLPTVRVGPGMSTETLEALAALQQQLGQRLEEQAATPEEARRANTQLRARMQGVNNYFERIETMAAELLAAIKHTGGPLSEHHISRLVEHVGFEIHQVPDLPHSTRSVTDLRNRRFYLPTSAGAGSPWSVLLQAVGHHLLEHRRPADYGEFLEQRVETNYFAAALMIPEASAVDLLARAKSQRELSVDDLRDAFAVSHETAAHRMTNLMTHHFDIPTHFEKVHSSGIIHKAWQNDGLQFPTDHSGAVEGQRACRFFSARQAFSGTNRLLSHFQYTDTPHGTYWCSARVEGSEHGEFSISFGVPYEHVKWFRGRATSYRRTSTCPDPACCQQPSPALADQWEGQAWPSARPATHMLAAMPAGAFPGVDETEVFRFLQRHAPAVELDEDLA